MTKYLILLIFFMTGCQQQIENRNSTGTSVVCFGDSLTAGLGAAAGQDYPSLLSQKINLPVFNAGVSGNTTIDALQRLDKDVLIHNPKLVIITLGANDYFHGMYDGETIDNMEKIIKRIKEHGAMVAWAEVQMGALSDPFIDDFTAMANREHILLIPNILGGIIGSPQLMHDQIHPNAEGYKIMAEKIYQKIKELL